MLDYSIKNEYFAQVVNFIQNYLTYFLFAYIMFILKLSQKDVRRIL